VADDFVDPVDGALVARIDGTGRSIADLEDSIAAAEDRLEVIEANLIRQFTALEEMISGIQLQANFLNQYLLSQYR
jgi:flagellar capping protein FliD